MLLWVWTLGSAFGSFTLCPAKGSNSHIWSAMYFQPISLDSQQSLAIQSHGLSTRKAIVWSGPKTHRPQNTHCIHFYFFLRQKADRPTPKHRRQFTTWQVFRQVERRFHSRDSNRQPLPWDLGIPLPSPGSLRSSRIITGSFESSKIQWFEVERFLLGHPDH